MPQPIKIFCNFVVKENAGPFTSQTLDIFRKKSDVFVMGITKERFERAVELVKTHIPDLKIMFKNTSRLMRFLGLITKLFNKEFLTNYTTTVMSRVYYPSPKYLSDDYTRGLEILFHEFVHLWDRKQSGNIAYVLRYLFPQWLALIPLLLTCVLPWFVSPAWLIILVGLLLTAIPLLPWPAPFRAAIELRGYVVNMAFHFWLYHVDDMADDSKWIATQFTGWSYYRMAPNRKRLLEKLAKYAEKIRTNTITDQPYGIIQSFLKGEKT